MSKRYLDVSVHEMMTSFDLYCTCVGSRAVRADVPLSVPRNLDSNHCRYASHLVSFVHFHSIVCSVATWGTCPISTEEPPSEVYADTVGTEDASADPRTFIAVARMNWIHSYYEIVHRHSAESEIMLTCTHRAI